MAERSQRRTRRSGRRRAAPVEAAAHAPATRAALEELAASLRMARSAVVVCIGALRHHDAGMDAEVANVLARACASRLDASLEKLAGLLLREPPATLRS